MIFYPFSHQTTSIIYVFLITWPLAQLNLSLTWQYSQTSQETTQKRGWFLLLNLSVDWAVCHRIPAWDPPSVFVQTDDAIEKKNYFFFLKKQPTKSLILVCSFSLRYSELELATNSLSSNPHQSMILWKKSSLMKWIRFFNFEKNTL